MTCTLELNSIIFRQTNKIEFLIKKKTDVAFHIYISINQMSVLNVGKEIHNSKTQFC